MARMNNGDNRVVVHNVGCNLSKRFRREVRDDIRKMDRQRKSLAVAELRKVERKYGAIEGFDSSTMSKTDASVVRYAYFLGIKTDNRLFQAAVMALDDTTSVTS